MAKLCEHCGKANNNFLADPLELGNGKILCHTCAQPISDDMYQLYYAKTKTEFFQRGNTIIEKSKALYSENIVNDIANAIQLRSQNMPFFEDGKSVEDDEHTDILYNNVGGKIKGLVSFFTWLGIIASIIAGIVIMFIDEQMILVGVLVILLGSLGSWLSGLLLYGYGQLIENSDKLVKAMKNK